MKVLKFLTPFIILAGAVGLFITMSKSSKRPNKHHGMAKNKVAVSITSAKKIDHTITISARAIATPLYEIDIASQVSGMVSEVHDQLMEGGFVKEGETLFALSPADFELKLIQAEASLAKAKYNFDLVKAQQKSAVKGFELVRKKMLEQKVANTEFSDLAKFTPQMQNALAGLKSAEATVEAAKLNLSRTKIKAPFSGYIKQVNLAKGQLVAAMKKVGTFYANTPLHISAALPVRDIVRLEMGNSKKLNVKISRKIGVEVHHWQGYVAKLSTRINLQDHLARAYIMVDQPFSDKGLELPVGMLVDISLTGEQLKGVYQIPAEAVRPGDTLWVAEQEVLKVHPIKILYKDQYYVYIRQRVEAEMKIITSSVPNFEPGLPLQIEL